MRTVLHRPAFASPHVVFDANKLRDRVAVTARLVDYAVTGKALVLPSEFLHEIARAKKPENTLRASLSAAAGYSQAVVVAHGFDRVSRYEVNTGAPATTILAEELTAHLQHLLEEMRLGRQTEVATLGAVARAERSSAASAFRARKTQLASYVDFWKRTIPRAHWPGFVTAYRRNRAVVIPALMEEVVSLPIIHDIFSKKWSGDLADALALEPSSTALWNILLIRLALDWALRGGFGGALPQRIGRDVGDLDYAWVALHCEEFVTADEGARAQFQDAKAIARRLWPRHAARFPAEREKE